MKEKTKVSALISKAFDACGDKDSLLTIHSYKGSGDVTFKGNPHDLVDGFVYILANGLKENAKKEERAFANSIFNAIFNILSSNGSIAVDLAMTLEKVMKDAENEIKAREKRKSRKVRKSTKNDEPRRSAPEEFNPSSHECLDCDALYDCWLRNKLLEAFKSGIIRNDDTNVNTDGEKKNNNKGVRNHGRRK